LGFGGHETLFTRPAPNQETDFLYQRQPGLPHRCRRVVGFVPPSRSRRGPRGGWPVGRIPYQSARLRWRPPAGQL